MENGGDSRQCDIAIIGGGFAGVYAAKRALKRLGHLGKRVCLIAEENHMVFQPMLPEVVGGSLSPRHVVNPIRRLCPDADVLKGRVARLDLAGKSLQLDGGCFSPCVTVRFDHVVLALGADVNLSRMPGMAEHAALMRNAGDAMKLRAAIIARMEEANLVESEDLRRRLLSFVVVGGGHSGVETAGQMIDLLRAVQPLYTRTEADEATVTLVHSRERLLPTLDENLGEHTKRRLEKMGVRVLLNRKVRTVTANFAHLDDGSKLAAATVVCTVGNAPHPLAVKLGAAGALPVENGKITVNSCGQVIGMPKVWAAGDCARFPKADGGFCPETAQFAMRQGELVGANIAAAEFGHPLEPFRFTGLGELAVIGHRSAVASIMGLQFSGIIAWFMWRTIYLSKLPGLDRKLRVMAEWTFDLFFPRDINLLTPRYSSPLEEMHLEPGDVLFHAGEPAFSFYAVKAGRIDLVDERGETVKTAAKGDHFGERALMEDKVWHFDAVAKEPTTLVAIDARTFDKLVGSMDLLERSFQRSAPQYARTEDVERALSRLPAWICDRTAAEVITREVATLTPETTLGDAMKLFQNSRHSLYPVVDAERRVTGAVRKRSVYDWLAHHDLDRDRKIGELPLDEILLTSAGARVKDLLEDLIRTGATKAAVVDEQERLCGIISLYDLLGRAPAA